jgi:phytoene dehydrogenase-like protein
MPSISYDVVVSGDDLSSVITATLCARRGLRTLLLAPFGATARYALGPFKLPIDPVVWPKNSVAVSRILRELRIDLTAKRKFRDATVAAHVVGPDFRIALGESLATELSREFGEAPAQAILDAWTAAGAGGRAIESLIGDDHGFPGGGFFERREISKLMQNAERECAGAGDRWKKSISAAPWLQSLPELWQRQDAVNDAMAARALDALSGGVIAQRGDADSMRELLLERFSSAGGETKIGRVSDASISWGKVTNLTLNNGDHIGAGQWLMGLAPSELVAVLGKKAPRKLEELALSANLVGYRYTLNIVLDETGLPEGMAPVVLSLGQPFHDRHADADLGPASVPSFTLCVSEPDDKGRCIVTVAATVATGAPLSTEDQREEAARLRRRIWVQLEELLPFFERHVVVSHSPHDGWAPMSTPVMEAPRGVPIDMRPIWKPTLPDSLGLAAMPYATGIKNITLCGDQIMPGLGIDGDFTAAWTAAKIACAIAGKKRDYLHNEVVGTPER